MDAELIRARLETAILECMDEAASRPMQWGVDDCVCWAAEPLRRVLGQDPIADCRGAWHSRESADRVIGPMGLGFRMLHAAKACGWKRIAPEQARCGDVGIGLYETPAHGKRPTTMICRADTARLGALFVARNELGFTVLPHGFVRLCWAVI